MIRIIKKSILNTIKRTGWQVTKIPPTFYGATGDVPDEAFYFANYSPWLGKEPFKHYYNIAAPKTLVSAEGCFILYSLLLQAISVEGDCWECGVYQGGTAALFAAILKDQKSSKSLYLFDTFKGMPETDPQKDLHKKGDFSDTSIEEVEKYVGKQRTNIFKKGFIPDTFSGLETAKIAFAHIDVDVYKSVLDCLNFIWPRVSLGGFVVFDDYGYPKCPGARKAVDEFFAGKPVVPLVLHTGQAIAFKSFIP